ncbi:MAG: AAA family ATPase [Leptolyngbyaceae cyanobacterium MO_188.B28]|nr:AAA family ATPase [Leptolyngbyaceae cyanobacterium MO_188.B28]
MSDAQPPSPKDPDSSTQIRQEIEGNKNQTIGQVLGGIVVYVSGGQAIFYPASSQPETEVGKPKRSDIGPNPYKGLLAFQETDGDRFFGRDTQIRQLWEKFRSLHEVDSAVRLLPVYGPSGSGKSSLARAGLIPELARRPLPGRDRARVAVLVPGTHPLEKLATVLARVATNDPIPVAKSREFCEELAQVNAEGEYDGLRRIANVLPDIAISPLIIVVDQLEEIYTLCKDSTERTSFIGNLLCAAADRAQRVSAIVTLRSDFLGETQKHTVLNSLFAEQGFLVRSMNEAELREAISQPAEMAGHPLDAATIQLLFEQTEGREGALPLFQFALTRIWEGMGDGTPPAKTLKDIGGVGGALAGEAQRVYNSLSPSEKEIARRLFLGLVQLGEGARDTRRRVAVASLMARSDEPVQFRRVMERFTDPGVRLMTVSAEGSEETAEVTHEALFEHWQQLNDWLDGSRDDIRFQRRLDEAAKYWEAQKRPAGLLWRRPDIDLLHSYHKRFSQQMTDQQLDFFQATVRRETQQKVLQGMGVSGLIALAAGMTWFGVQASRAEQRALARQFAAQAEQLLNQPSVTQKEAGALLAAKSLEPLQRWKEESGDVNQALRSSLRIQLSLATLDHDAEVLAVAFSADGGRVATASSDNTARVWDADSGETLATLNHDAEVNAMAFSADGRRVTTASSDKTARVHWVWSYDLAQQLCRRLNRNLAASEWEKYIQSDLTDYSLTCPKLPVHLTVVDKAQKLAAAGDVEEATALFRRVLKLARDADQELDIDPSTDVLDQNPKAVALKFSAVSIVREAESLARDGNVNQAISRYQKALSLNPEIDLNPATEGAIEQDPEAVAKAIAAAAGN